MRSSFYFLLFVILLTLIFGGLELVSCGYFDSFSKTIRPWLRAKFSESKWSYGGVVLSITILLGFIAVGVVFGFYTFLVVWLVVWLIYTVLITAESDEVELPKAK